MTFYSPVERTRYFLSEGKIPTWTKSEDEIESIPWDLTDRLNSGETVSSVATDVDGVTLDSSSLATPVFTMVVSDTNGTIRATATTSAGRVLEQDFRFVDKPRRQITNDYRYSV